MGREFELKYQANPVVLAQIQEKFQGFTSISMETAYYDTADRALSEKRWMLRLRRENGKPVCTLKTPLPDGSRGEWETECGSIESAVFTLCKLGAPQELAVLAASGLRQTCAARFMRQAAILHPEGCTVELALDQGCFSGGGREIPFAELEVELKSGSEAAAAAFGEALAMEYGLSPEPKGKVQRALALIDQ